MRKVLQNFHRNLKRLVEWFWEVPARVSHMDLRQISKPVLLKTIAYTTTLLVALSHFKYYQCFNLKLY